MTPYAIRHEMSDVDIKTVMEVSILINVEDGVTLLAGVTQKYFWR